MNMNKEMMFGVLLVLMFGPDMGPLLLLYPQSHCGISSGDVHTLAVHVHWLLTGYQC